MKTRTEKLTVILPLLVDAVMPGVALGIGAAAVVYVLAWALVTLTALVVRMLGAAWNWNAVEMGKSVDMLVVLVFVMVFAAVTAKEWRRNKHLKEDYEKKAALSRAEMAMDAARAAWTDREKALTMAAAELKEAERAMATADAALTAQVAATTAAKEAGLMTDGNNLAEAYLAEAKAASVRANKAQDEARARFSANKRFIQRADVAEENAKVKEVQAAREREL